VDTDGSRELARHLGLSVPTTHRLAAAMVTHDLLRRGPDSRLHPGQRFASSSLAAAAAPALEDLRRDSGETAQLWVRRANARPLGAIALGHPIGVSGARIMLHLALELGRRGGGVGVAALCGGGGHGDALILQVPAPAGTPSQGCRTGPPLSPSDERTVASATVCGGYRRAP
jgi:hypothetical protein